MFEKHRVKKNVVRYLDAFLTLTYGGDPNDLNSTQVIRSVRSAMDGVSYVNNLTGVTGFHRPVQVTIRRIWNGRKITYRLDVGVMVGIHKRVVKLPIRHTVRVRYNAIATKAARKQAGK